MERREIQPRTRQMQQQIPEMAAMVLAAATLPATRQGTAVQES
jgi:hypothetical protein